MTLIQAAESLSLFPARHPIIAEGRGRAIRQFVSGDYLVWYVIRDDFVDVVSFLLGGDEQLRCLAAGSWSENP